MTDWPSVEELARRCAVEIHSNTFLGSGFFVAQDAVLTCAHVVESRSHVTIAWDGNRFDGHVTFVAPSERGRGDYWTFPDIAIVKVNRSLDYPIAPLSLELP